MTFLTRDSVSAVTDATFTTAVLEHDGPVLVEFWAEWCGPCHMIAPVLEEIAKERAGTLTIRKINADEHPTIARDCQVMSLPTLLLFRDGTPILSLVGARPKARLLTELDKALDQD